MEIKLSINKQPANIYIAGVVKSFMNSEVKSLSRTAGISISIKELLATLQLIIILFISLAMVNTMHALLVVAGFSLMVFSFAIFKRFGKKGGIA